MKIAKIFLIASILFVLSQSAAAWAADGSCHTLEVPLGNFTQACGPAEYLTKIYTISVGVAVALAVVMIVYAGIIYISSGDNAGKQKEAKSQITQAIFGLILLLASYLILRTVNPDLTDLGKWQNLPAQQVSTSTPTIIDPKCQQAKIDNFKCLQNCSASEAYTTAAAKQVCASLCSSAYLLTGCAP
jgi:cytochrome bd-type quinol oxidase subunit 2